MKSPDINLTVRLTRDQVEASFAPCPICGEIERETTSGVYRIEHDYSLHFPNDPRMRARKTMLSGVEQE